eukprot:15470867-Alexandrium_andersonii.AAC.1
MSLDASGDAAAPSDERRRVRVGIPVRRSSSFPGPVLASLPEVVMLDVLIPIDPDLEHPRGMGIVLTGLRRRSDVKTGESGYCDLDLSLIHI